MKSTTCGIYLTGGRIRVATMLQNSESLCNVARLQVHVPLMHCNALVSGRFHRNVDVNTAARPFRLGAVSVIVKPEVGNLCVLARDSDGLGDHVLMNRSTIVPGKNEPAYIRQNPAGLPFSLDLLHDLDHWISERRPLLYSSFHSAASRNDFPALAIDHALGQADDVTLREARLLRNDCDPSEPCRIGVQHRRLFLLVKHAVSL